MYKITIICMY